MDITSLIILLVVGLVAGWLAGLIMKKGKNTLVVNMVVGVIGAFVGSFLFQSFGLVTNGLIGMLITAIVGAIVLLLLVGFIKK